MKAIRDIKLFKMEETNVTTRASVVGKENWYSMLLQIAVPFVLAGMGTISAGIILGNVQNWIVYKEIESLFVLVPSLCGLKGNLDMCVASRFSTHSNLGHLNSFRSIQGIVIGNVALVQVQSIVCAFLLCCFTVLAESVIMSHGTTAEHIIIMTSAAVFTASTSCMILDTLLMVVILFSQKYNINPDYMATPIVASIGDVVSISLLSFSSASLYDMRETHLWIGIGILLAYGILLPFWITTVYFNRNTRSVLLYGWLPVVCAITISELGGLVLKNSVNEFEGFAVFSPIINGIGGNLVSVQASSMATTLYLHSVLGKFPPGTKICERPDRVLFWSSTYSKLSRILIIISIPGNILFITLADLCYTSKFSLTFVFIISYTLTSLMQLAILMWLGHLVVHTSWKLKADPDSTAIPYLTACGDLLGTSFLAIMFHILREIGQGYDEKQSSWIKINYVGF